MTTIRRTSRVLLTAGLLLLPQAARAHFLWLTVERQPERGGAATVQAFLNETPAPGGSEFLKFVRGVKPTADGQPLAVTLAEETADARWVGQLPPTFDAALDLGVKSKAGTTYRLYYTARAQTGASSSGKEKGDGLRVRLVNREGKNVVQVTFDGKAASKARIKAYPESGDAKELTADADGFAAIEGVAEGKTALWANWIDPKAGEAGGKAFTETRYYATLTVTPTAAATTEAPAAFAAMPAPAVNSFGGAVLGDWLYVYSGHVGRTHQYSVETTSRHFRRLNLKDRATWEDLPMAKDVQGVALVTDGKFVYRVGGMSARNQPDQDHDLYSVADFAKFDPESKTWTDLAPLPQPRSTHDAVVIGQKVYAVGGWTMKGATEKATYVKDIAVFDLAKPEAGWATTEQPFRRRALSVAEAGGKLYVLGGLNDIFKVERRVDVLDPATNAWSQGPDLPDASKTEGFGTSAFGVGGRLYYSGAAGRIFRLDAEGRSWEAVGAWAQPRITHRILPGPGQSLLAVGGNTKGKQTPVVESVDLTRLSLNEPNGRQAGQAPRAGE